MDTIGSITSGYDQLTASSQGDLDAARKIASSGGDVAEAASKFEALLVSMLVREMRQTLTEGFFGTGPGADSYASMLDEKIGEQLAQRPLFGIAEMLEANTRQRAAQNVAEPIAPIGPVNAPGAEVAP